MRVLVCGSRTFAAGHVVHAVLHGLRSEHVHPEVTDFVVVEGGARGADAHAALWAKHFATAHVQYPADWDRHGKAAGFIRNQQMLDEGKPDVVWAFVDKPLAESRGTADMVRRARKAGVPVRVVEVL